MVAKALTGPYRIDRDVPPTAFYTPKQAAGIFRPGIHIFAQSDDIPDRNSLTLGLVSRQTPFGQGTFYVFAKSQLRRATTVEVLAALDQEHLTKGGPWKPECPEIRNLNVLLSGGQCPDEDLARLSRAEARRLLGAYKVEYAGIMQKWRLISGRQKAAVLADLG